MKACEECICNVHSMQLGAGNEPYRHFSKEV